MVWVIDDLAEVHRLQQQDHSWSDDMALVCELRVSVNLYRLVMLLSLHVYHTQFSHVQCLLYNLAMHSMYVLCFMCSVWGK